MIALAATIAAAVAAGWGAEHRWPIGASALAPRLLALMLYALMTPIAFVTMVRLHVSTGVGVGIGLALLSLVMVGVIAWLIGTRLLRLPRPSTGALMVSSFQVNTGYLGFPLTVVLLGHGALAEAVAYDALVSTPALLLGAFGTGAVFGDRAGTSVRERAVAFLTRNPVLIAVVLGLLAPDSLAPGWLVDASQVAVIALAPIGFFCVGVTLAAEAEAGIVPALTPAVGWALVLRLLVAPGLLLALAAPLVVLPDAYMLQAAMPCGIGGLLVAHAYGLDLRAAAGAVAWSTVVVVAVAAVVTLVS